MSPPAPQPVRRSQAMLETFNDLFYAAMFSLSALIVGHAMLVAM